MPSVMWQLYIRYNDENMKWKLSCHDHNVYMRKKLVKSVHISKFLLLFQ